MAAHSMNLVRYVADNGALYTFRQQEQIRVAAGNTIADGSEIGRLPQGLKPRKLHAKYFSAGGVDQAVGLFSRSLVIGSTANPLWSHATKVVNLADYDSGGAIDITHPNVMRDFIVTGRTGEQQTF